MIRTIYDNYTLWETYPDEELTEMARINGWIEEDEEPTENFLWQLRYDEDSFAWDEIKEELDAFFKGKTCIFFGSCGIWDGRHDGGAIGDFWDLFNIAVSDCDYISITDDGGALFLKASHHDGTNYYQIKVLTDEGEAYFDRWNYGNDSRTERDAHKQIIKRYSHRPQFYKNVYC